MSLPLHRQVPNRPARRCSRAGCATPVKKSTAKYCSVLCCSTDPVRIAQLRERARASSRHVLPMSRQLSMPFDSTEQMLARLCEGHEDTPLGMARLVV